MRAFLLVFIPLSALKSQTPTYEALDAIVWMQSAVEYQAATSQTYRTARASLLRALEDKNWTAAFEQSGNYRDLPPAVILDLDETVLDNSAYMVPLIKEGKQFSDDSWQAWVAQARAGILPGAIEFLKFAHMHGVTPFYITNRVCNPRAPDDPTVKVLRNWGAPLRAENSNLFCKEETSDKTRRRRLVAAGNRILLLFGDDLGDFLTIAPEQANAEGRQQLFRFNEQFWGDRWFVLPNPSYGSWERAVGTDVKKEAVLRCFTWVGGWGACQQSGR